jgi:hypothetical protein
MRILIWLTLAAAVAGAQTPCAQPQQWAPCDFVFDMEPAEAAQHPQPMQSVAMHAEFRSPKKKTFLAPAFFDGGRRLVIRMTPTEAGEWDYRLTSNIARWQGKIGTFTVATSKLLPFIQNANVHHWRTLDNKPHFLQGETLLRAGFLPRAEFDQLINTRAEQGFNHLRVSLLGAESDHAHVFPKADQPNVAYLQEFESRLHAAHQKGFVVDLVLADNPAAILKQFPTWQERERFIRYTLSRLAPFNVTWQITRAFEGVRDGRQLVKELGLLVNKHDPYGHPKSTGAAGTAAPLLGDMWMNYITYGTADEQLGAVEHQLFTLPFVASVTAESDEGQRKALWNVAMSGQYPVKQGGPESATKYWKIFQEFFAETRFWELEPYFNVDGGRAVALTRDFGGYDDDGEGVEYILYVEKPTGPVEVNMRRHGYNARWLNPVTGESIKIKDFKSDKFTSEPPNLTQDWVLHISREGRKRGLQAYKFESRPVPVQEPEIQAKFIVFEMESPGGNEISLSKPTPFMVKLKTPTRATRTMMYVWTGEVTAQFQGFRVLATGKQGEFRIPPEIVKELPAVLSLRLHGLNANGKLYILDKVFKLVP